MLKKAFIFIVSCLCTLLIFTNLNNNHVNADTKTYNIGTDVTYPPFEFANKNNQYVGIDIDLMKAIAKEEGFKVNIQPIGFNSAVQSLQSGQIDGVIAGMAITDERKQKFDF